MDRFALRIEDAGLQGDEHARFHCFACQVASEPALWPRAIPAASFTICLPCPAHFVITGSASPAL
jgi:hypothetical protein